MAAPIVYGQIQVQITQGKPKLVATITPRVKISVNKFDGNNAIYMHINSRNKAVSLSYEEYEELCGLKNNLDQKIQLLEENSQQQVQQILPLQQIQGHALQVLGQNQAQLIPPLHQAQGQAHPGQNQGQAHTAQVNHGQIQVAMPNVWDDIQFM